jgi:hypothetical protein
MRKADDLDIAVDAFIAEIGEHASAEFTELSAIKC